jgi:hypothetical protein
MLGMFISMGISSAMLFLKIRGRRWSGLVVWSLILLGGICNAVVMLANQDRMPVLAPCIEIPAYDHEHSVATGSSRLLFLADVHGPVWARYSLGDVCIFLGTVVALVVCVVGVLKPWFQRRRQRCVRVGF